MKNKILILQHQCARLNKYINWRWYGQSFYIYLFNKFSSSAFLNFLQHLNFLNFFSIIIFKLSILIYFQLQWKKNFLPIAMKFLHPQHRCISIFRDKKNVPAGFALGSVEGRVAIQYINAPNPRDNFTFKCHRSSFFFLPLRWSKTVTTSLSSAIG